MTRNPNKVVFIFALILGAYAIGFWLYSPAEPGLTFAAATEQQPAPRLDDLDQPAEPADEPEPSAPIEPPKEKVIVSTVPGGMRVVPPEFSEYTLQPGDTSFAAISRRVYGTSRHADAISRSNPFTSPAKLRVGQRIKVPADPKNIQGSLERVEERIEHRVTSTSGIPSLLDQPAAPAQPPAVTEPRVHVVRKGETLSDIAKLYYGSAARWRPILEANSDKLSRPERIKAGMELIIPD